MTEIKVLDSYNDNHGNVIICPTIGQRPVLVNFRGSNNRLIISPNAKIQHLNIQFDCDNGLVQIGSHSGVSPLKLYARVGQDSSVRLGDNVSTTDKLTITAVEGADVVIGDDVMVATDVEIRTDDAHPIFDVITGQRVNLSQPISIGNHVWLAKRAIIFGGVSIGDGSVVGFGSLVTKDIPNNCIAAGVPARVVRKNIAWERPHLSGEKPFYKPDASTVKKSPYWNSTRVLPV
ncbi:acyltransferase [Arthrobacter psychrochitiniphilus]|uniref:Acyltransferase n=1 Tax=Arthrobacter psychrochitiniphilus TaxID=291045 RepID=A0A2V3DMN7_9MICC|nr:acyltransferase [Arthrobacter psychrochitiniphilus]NYG18053.1 acetyltransferase-like isoleucine patch superfamily enzyme [Arthrobacter psychrochitiniphilus]PXA64223.1 acyltransferase [Arthrobacter psychrochitiniphilus]